MDTHSSQSITILKEEEGIRIDKLLPLRFRHYSRNYFHFLIDQHAILNKNLPIKKKDTFQEGETLTISFLQMPQLDLTPEEMPLEILYEDDEILVINKPSDLVTHPAPGSPHSTLINGVLYHCNLPEGSDETRPGVVHRLDKDTSGVMVLAKSSFSHQNLSKQFAQRKVQKSYLAICVGKPKNEWIKTFIGRNPKDRKKMCVLEKGGKEAITELHLLKHDHELSFVQVHLHTGRTHQIRVHLQHIHCPILGDPLYGNQTMNKKYGIYSQLLHAESLAFSHPKTNIPLSFSAPLPEVFHTFFQTETPN